MATMVNCFTIQGVEACLVNIEIKIMDGQPETTIIGLGDLAVKEAADRINSAIDEAGYNFPKKRVIISLAPSDLKKYGSHYDLAMAIGVLCEDESISISKLDQYAILGELSLDGKIRPIKGILPMVIKAKDLGLKKVIVPLENIPEAKLVKNIEIIGFDTLNNVIEYLEGKISYSENGIMASSNEYIKTDNLDFLDVIGQDELIDAVVLAAAGGHNLLMIGTPGCGKTMIAQRISTILPKMTEKESLEVTKIYSICGILPKNHSLITERPFRSPHHNASLNSLVGGGVNAMPGEVSLAHNGVLFLDELSEFSKHTLDALRQPIEDKKISISRVNGTHTFPANFMFVTAMNPCPCGYFPDDKCKCTDHDIIKFRNKISGPIMDRIDIQKEVKPVDFFNNTNKNSRSSIELRKIVTAAREIQQERFKNEEEIFCNSQMTTSHIQKYCNLDSESLELLKDTSEMYSYSARVIHKFLRMALTNADINKRDKIIIDDIKKVIEYRDLDKKNSLMFSYQ